VVFFANRQVLIAYINVEDYTVSNSSVKYAISQFQVRIDAEASIKKKGRTHQNARLAINPVVRAVYLCLKSVR
jgi:hypothetical protein